MLGSILIGRSTATRPASWQLTSCLAFALSLGAMACGSDKTSGDGSDDSGTTTGSATAGDGGVPKSPVGSSTSDAGPLVRGPHCQSGSTEPCEKTFVTTFGTSIELGAAGAIMEPNLGAPFKNMVSPLDSNSACSLFASIFQQSKEQTDQLLGLMDLDLSLFTVYRPATWEAGKKYPIVTWGNGTCAQPEGYGALLRYVASQGFVVFAANSRYVGTDNAMLHALDFAFAANADPTSPYYQKLDTDKVAAMGHSQGGNATVAASDDPRVKTAIIFNGGNTAAKPYLTISGDRDLGGRDASLLRTAVNEAPKAAFLFYHMVPGTGGSDGHLTLMTQPERVIAPTVAFLKFQLLADPESKAFFVGADCKLCGHDAEYEFGQHGLE